MMNSNHEHRGQYPCANCAHEFAATEVTAVRNDDDQITGFYCDDCHTAATDDDHNEDTGKAIDDDRAAAGFSVLPCHRCGQRFAGEGQAVFNTVTRSILGMLCPPCQNLPPQPETRRCTLCGIERTPQAVEEITDKAGKVTGLVCQSCAQPAKPDPTGHWRNAITLAGLYGNSEGASDYLDTLDPAELKYTANALVGLLYARASVGTDIEDTAQWLQYFRNGVAHWFDQS